MRNQGKLETVQEMLPFLDSEREKEERAQLLEEQGQWESGEESVSGSAKGK